MKAAIDHDACAAARAAMVAARRAEHGLLVEVAALEARGVATASGYRTVRRLLEDLWHVDPARARRMVTQAALLVPGSTLAGEPLTPVLPATAAAHEQGRVEDGHLRVVAATMDHLARVPGLTPERFAEAEVILADAAGVLAPAGLDKVARRLIATLDPDGTAPAEEDGAGGEVHLLRRRDGSLHGTLRLTDRADAELVVEVFDRLAAPAGPDDPRTLAQRRAEVLADLCAQAASPTGIANPDHDPEAQDGDNEHDGDGDGEGWVTPGPTRPGASGARAPGCPTMPVLGRALLTVTMDLEWLQTTAGHGLLDSDQPVDPATARRLACDAGIVPMVLGTRSEPLDVGRLSYTVPDGIRRALHARDGGCTFPGCTRRPDRCHAHHIRHWADHGETKIDNLALLCRYHHVLIHHDHWTITMIDGRPWYNPPRWIDPEQRPRPGGRHPLATTA